MTENRQNKGTPRAGGKKNAGADGDKHKSSGNKTPSRKGLFALVIIAVASVAVPTVWAGYLSLQLLWAPVSLPQPHNYEAALSEILELQRLAISEAKPGEAASFVTHVGCAAPAVWQDEGVLENVKRMVEAGVDVKLLAGRTSNAGNALPYPEWPNQLQAKLNELEIAGILHMRDRELPKYSVVVGSVRHPLACIC